VDSTEGVEKFIPSDSEAMLAREVELTEKFLGGGNIFFEAIDFEEGISDGDFDCERFFSLAEERVVCSVEFRQGVGVFEGKSLLAHPVT
jgi:hypothetical protein